MCVQGFKRSAGFLCESCMDSNEVLVLLASGIALAVVVFAYMIYQSRATASKPNTTHGVLLKLLMNSMQNMAQAAAFDFKWYFLSNHSPPYLSSLSVCFHLYFY